MFVIITPYSIYKRYLFGFRDDKGQYKMRNFRFLQNRANILPQGDWRICDDCMVREWANDHLIFTFAIHPAIGSGSFSASCLSNFSSVKINSMRLTIKTIPRKTQLHITPNCLNNTLNISKTTTPRPFKPIKYIHFAQFDFRLTHKIEGCACWFRFRIDQFATKAVYNWEYSFQTGFLDPLGVSQLQWTGFWNCEMQKSFPFIRNPMTAAMTISPARLP